MKFKPMKVQDRISTMALESHKNIAPINCDKFFKITATLPYFCARITHWTYLIYHFFFLFGILTHFFFLLFCNTLKNSNAEFHNFPVITEILINPNSQHIFKKTEET